MEAGADACVVLLFLVAELTLLVGVWVAIYYFLERLSDIAFEIAFDETALAF